MNSNEDIILEQIRHYIETQIGPIDALADLYADDVITVETAVELNRLEEPYELSELRRHVSDKVYSMLDCTTCELYLHVNELDGVLEITADILMDED